MKLEFKTSLTNEDGVLLEKILQNTNYFNDEEIAIAIELIDDNLQKQQQSDYKFLIAYLQTTLNTVVGYTCFGHIPGTLSSYDLYWIVVDPLTQNKGVGKQLLNKTEQFVQESGGNRLYAETSGRQQYHSTQQFYLNNNFTLEARLKDFYAPNDDKLIFTKNIQKKHV